MSKYVGPIWRKTEGGWAVDLTWKMIVSISRSASPHNTIH